MLDFAVFAEAFFFDVLADSCCRLMLAHSGLQAWQTLPSSWLFDRWAGSHASFGSGRGLKWNERDQTPITHSMSGMSCHEFMTRFDDPAMILPDRSTDIGGFLHLLLWLVVLCGFNMFQHVSTIFHSTLTCCITYSDIFVYIHIYIYIYIDLYLFWMMIPMNSYPSGSWSDNSVGNLGAPGEGESSPASRHVPWATTGAIKFG